MGTLSVWIWIQSLMLILTINSHDTIGSDLEMVVTGVERERDNDHQVTEPSDVEPSPSPDETAYGRTEGEKQNVIIVVSYEGDTDPMDPHNWSLLRRFACTALFPGLDQCRWHCGRLPLRLQP